MNLIIERHPESVKLNQQAKYLGQRSYYPKTHTHTADRMLYTTTKVVGSETVETKLTQNNPHYVANCWLR